MFNENFAKDFEDFKKEQQTSQEKTKLEEGKKLDCLEQYQRLNSVRIYGIPETDNEDTSDLVAKTLKRELKIRLDKADFDISHRLGPIKDGEDKGDKPRPIIVKFLQREQRLSVLRARKDLKGKKISIHPDLTRPRAYLLKQQQDKLKKTANVWSDFNGRIWRDPIGNEKKNKAIKRVELFPSRFPGIYEADEVDFRNMKE